MIKRYHHSIGSPIGACSTKRRHRLAARRALVITRRSSEPASPAHASSLLAWACGWVAEGGKEGGGGASATPLAPSRRPATPPLV